MQRARFWVLVSASAFGMVLSLSNAASAAWVYQVLYTFCPGGGSCTDGQSPAGGLLFDKQGNLYGTTQAGGTGQYIGYGGGGTIFEFSPVTSTYKVLYNFCSKKRCVDGASPSAALIMDKKGNLWGTTTGGGNAKSGNFGEVFELKHNADYSAWTLKEIHGFGETDGAYPYGPLTYAGANSGAVYDGKSTLYGTTSGYPYGAQTVFSLARTKKVWTLTTIYSGVEEFGGVIFDSSGNLYGTSQEGGVCSDGSDGSGFVYELSPGEQWTGTVLHTFGCGENDSINPDDTLMIDSRGNMWGTTYGQPDPICYGGDCGTVFELTPNGDSWTYQFPPIYLQPYGIAAPFAGLVESSNGNLYGTTTYGSGGDGSIFEIEPGVGLNVLWSACGGKNCQDGITPRAPLIVDKSGNLFGVMSGGGDPTSSAGTIFEMTNIGDARR